MHDYIYTIYPTKTCWFLRFSVCILLPCPTPFCTEAYSCAGSFYMSLDKWECQRHILDFGASDSWLRRNVVHTILSQLETGNSWTVIIYMQNPHKTYINNEMLLEIKLAVPMALDMSCETSILSNCKACRTVPPTLGGTLPAPNFSQPEMDHF